MKGRQQYGGIDRQWLSAIAGCLLATSVGAAPGAEKQTVSFTYQFEAPRIETNGAGAHLTLSGGQQLQRLGEPAMPFRTARLLIPPGYAVETAEALPLLEPEKLEGNWQLEYADQPYTRSRGTPGAFAAGRSRRVYESDSLYPPSMAELISVQRLAGHDIALVRVFPVRYRPSSGELVFAPRLNLRLTLTPQLTSGEAPVRPPDSGPSASRVAAFVDNPEQLTSFKLLASAAVTSTNAVVDYLLITSSNLAAAFQPLVDRKIHDGLAVKVAFVESITNEVAGRDVPEKIRNYIRKAYADSGINYVLLGGGTTIIPCRYAFVRADLPSKDSYLPCDLYYACLDGSWNGNGDKHWGEPGDGENEGDVDLLAEVYVGRAPVSTVEQVKTFVEKTVRYELSGNPNLDTALLMATYLGEFPGGPCQGADIFDPLLPLLSQWRLNWLDDRPEKMPRWSRAEVISELNASPHIALYNGYGDPDILMRMHTWELKQLTNVWPFLACSVACSAGQFDHGKFAPDSFGETLVNGSSHGAFATILNARAGWFDPQHPWKYSGEFQAKLFAELLQTGHRNLGMANQHSKEDLIGLVERDGPMTYRWCYYGITLLGDPHVPFRVPEGTARSAAGTQENAIAGSTTLRKPNLNH